MLSRRSFHREKERSVEGTAWTGLVGLQRRKMEMMDAAAELGPPLVMGVSSERSRAFEGLV